MARSKDSDGITLLEVLITITFGLILFSATMPTLNHWINRQRLNHEMYKLYQLIHKARHTAISKQSNIILCSIDKQQRCQKNWNKTILLFQDVDNNKRYTSTDNLIIKTSITDKLQYTYSRSKIRFNQSGQAYGHNGTMVICHQNLLSRGVIIAGTGRIRFAADENKDGLVEDWQGKNLNCR